MIKEGRGDVLYTEWKGLANDKLCLDEKKKRPQVGEGM